MEAEGMLGVPLRRLCAARERVEMLEEKAHSCTCLALNSEDVNYFQKWSDHSSYGDGRKRMSRLRGVSR